MRDKDVPKMAFKTIYKHYEFVMMSFGLTNTLSPFIDLMNWVFWDYLNSFVNVFIDDIMVYLNNKGEHMDHLRVVL